MAQPAYNPPESEVGLIRAMIAKAGGNRSKALELMPEPKPSKAVWLVRCRRLFGPTPGGKRSKNYAAPALVVQTRPEAMPGNVKRADRALTLISGIVSQVGSGGDGAIRSDAAVERIRGVLAMFSANGE